jgi:hypothetical protein
MPHLLLAKGDRIDYWIPQHIIQYCYGTHPPANSLFETRMNGTGTTRQFIPQARSARLPGGLCVRGRAARSLPLARP